MTKLVALGAAAVYVVHALLANRVVDDCYITFRYVVNWVAGHGPVFNPGERVEGYTNFLWTALLAVVHRLAPELDLLAVAQALSLASGVAIVAMVARRAFARHDEAGLLRAFAPLLLAFHAPFVVWSTGGLETLLFTLLVFGSAIAELRRLERGGGAWQAPLLLALATMTRPDGIVFLAALLLFRLARGVLARKEGPPHRLVAIAVLVFAAIYVPYWIWRWRYYGKPLPNTFYAKVGGGLAPWRRGLEYLAAWARDGSLPLALLAAIPVATRWREAWVQLFALHVGAGLGFVVSVGGDSLGIYRFMVPLAPFLALLAQEGLLALAAAVRGRSPQVARAAAGALLAAGLAALTIGGGAQATVAPVLWPARFAVERAGLTFPGDGVIHTYRWFDHYFVDRLKVAGRWLDRYAPADAWVAASPAGSLGFHMRQPLLDMLGLNDAHIASVQVAAMGHGRAGHEKGDGAYVLSRRPRYVLLGNVCVHDRPLEESEIQERCARLKSERELFADPEFHRLYRRRSVPIRDGELGGIAPANRHLFQWFTFYELR